MDTIPDFKIYDKVRILNSSSVPEEFRNKQGLVLYCTGVVEKYYKQYRVRFDDNTERNFPAYQMSRIGGIY
jgi:hypothetical protein